MLNLMVTVFLHLKMNASHSSRYAHRLQFERLHFAIVLVGECVSSGNLALVRSFFNLGGYYTLFKMEKFPRISLCGSLLKMCKSCLIS